MWSEGGVEGLSEPLFGGGAASKEPVRHLWGSSSRLLDQTADDQVSSSTSPSQEEAAVDLSLKTQVESSSAALEGRRPSVQSVMVDRTMNHKGRGSKVVSTELVKESCREDASSRLAEPEPIAVPESSCSPPLPTSTRSTTAAQTDQREFTSVKEVLLEMTNRKNGHHAKLPLPTARWGIMKKETEQVLLKVPKYIVDDKKGAFPRPTALVNPFPGQQTSIKDWLNGKKIEASPKDVNKNCTASKMVKSVVRQRIPRGANGKIMSRKKPLTTIVAQLAGSVQSSQTSQVAQTDSAVLQKIFGTESVSILSSHHLSGGEVSITETSPDISVVDRLKRLGTVIEIEDQAESNSLKLLEKMTKSVVTDGDTLNVPLQPMAASSPKPVSLNQSKSSKVITSRPPKLQHQLPPSPPSPPVLQPVLLSPQLTLTPKVMTNVPSKTTVQPPMDPEQSQPTESKPPKSQPVSKVQNNSDSSKTVQPLKVQTTTSQPTKTLTVTPTNKVQTPGSPSPKIVPLSFTPKVQFAVKSKAKNSKPMKKQSKSPPVTKKLATNKQPSTPPVSESMPTLYISKDVTLIPKEPTVPIHEKIEPSLLEPVIDIVEDESLLSQDGTFLFKTDSYFNVNLPNEQKVFSCDICSAVYTHANLLKKHYMRLHISRKYISEKDMETFNIDPEPFDDTDKGKLIFRCHTCKECFATKNELRSHLTDHPPVAELVKQNNKSHPIYKCENCSALFKWRKQFGRHKKGCKPSPPPDGVVTKPDLFHCLYCNETFLNAHSKRNHILSNHPYVRRKHCCVFCKKDGFPTNVSLFLHLLNSHPTVYFACQICKERFTHLEELKAHVDKKHEQDESLRTSIAERTSTLKQEKDYYLCDTCQRKFLIENSFKEHVCFPEKQEKPKLQKIKKKSYPLSERLEKSFSRNVDFETLYYSQVARNVQDNLLNHLDGKIYKIDSSEDENYGAPSPNVSTRTFLNFSDGFPDSSEILMDPNGGEIPARVKAPWEKYTFPKNYDGRCGLTSYIKDTSYLDISTQLIMRRNLQRLNMLPMRESPSNDVPSAVALERLGAECAESFGQIKKEKTADDAEEEVHELGSFSGEWVRDRMYVCSTCRWETPCLWTMEDHKYVAHPRVHCPQHELIGEQTELSQTIFIRLTDVPSPPFKGPRPSTPPDYSKTNCTKCFKSGFSNQSELHIHILECAGVVVEPLGPVGYSKRKRRRTRRRPRRGLKRNIPQTPQKLPHKQRTKPGDTDTIQRMIANLPPKRVSRKVFSPYDEEKARQNMQKTAAPKSGKKKGNAGKRSHSEPPRSQMKDDRVMLQKPTLIKKEQDYIDTSAEGGDVLSSLRMMPVRSVRAQSGPDHEAISVDKKDLLLLNQAEDKEMPKLEIEKDISPVESAEIPVLSPVERKEDKKEKEDLICGISFVDGMIKYETVSSVSQETKKIQMAGKKRKSSSSPNEPKKKKACKGPTAVTKKKQTKEEVTKSSPCKNNLSSKEKSARLSIEKAVDLPTEIKIEPSPENEIEPSTEKSVDPDEKPFEPSSDKTVESPVKKSPKKGVKSNGKVVKSSATKAAKSPVVKGPKSPAKKIVKGSTRKGLKKTKASVGKILKPLKETTMDAPIENDFLSLNHKGNTTADIELSQAKPDKIETHVAFIREISEQTNEVISLQTTNIDSPSRVKTKAVKSVAKKQAKGKSQVKQPEKQDIEPMQAKPDIIETHEVIVEEISEQTNDIISLPSINIDSTSRVKTKAVKSPVKKQAKGKSQVKQPEKQDVESTQSKSDEIETQEAISEEISEQINDFNSLPSIDIESPSSVKAKIVKSPVKKQTKGRSKVKQPEKQDIELTQAKFDEIETQAIVTEISEQINDVNTLLSINNDSPSSVKTKAVKSPAKKQGKGKSQVKQPEKQDIESTQSKSDEIETQEAIIEEISEQINEVISLPSINIDSPSSVKAKVVKSPVKKRAEGKSKVKQPEQQVPMPKRRGRPKGGLTRKSLKGVEVRRSNRRSLKNDIEDQSIIKFDEILPCEEDEVKEVIKKPEKPKRKPRTVKEPIVDSTTIIVQVEVHPEPVLKRKAPEISSNDDFESESNLHTKRIKDDQLSLEELKDNDSKLILENTDFASESAKSNSNEEHLFNHLNSSNLTKNETLEDLPDSANSENLVSNSIEYNKEAIDENVENIASSEIYIMDIENNDKNLASSITMVGRDITATSVNNEISEVENITDETSNVKIVKDLEICPKSRKSTEISSNDDFESESNLHTKRIKDDQLSLEELRDDGSKLILENTNFACESVESNSIEEHAFNHLNSTSTLTKNETLIDLPETAKSENLVNGSIENHNEAVDEIVENVVSLEIDKMDIENIDGNPASSISTEDRDSTTTTLNNEISEVENIAEETSNAKIKDSKKSPKSRKKNAKKNDMLAVPIELETKTEKSISSDKLNEIEKDKVKKVKKIKKDANDVFENKKLKKNSKRKKIMKKMAKIKKRPGVKSHSEGKVSKVLNIAGFKWEVSELEAPPIVESSSVEPESSKLLPDSSVEEELPIEEMPVLIEEEPVRTPEVFQAPVQTPEVFQSPVQTPEVFQAPVQTPEVFQAPVRTPEVCQASVRTPEALQAPVQQSPAPSPLPSVHVKTETLQASMPAPLPSNPVSARSVRHWESTAWEPPTPDPSLGTIIDSVNKLLNEPESTYSPLGLPSYSLADLQKAMGASDDEMAVLQQLGEASLQISSSEGSCNESMKGCDNDDWNGEKCIMDLDNHTTLQKLPGSSFQQSVHREQKHEVSSDQTVIFKETPQEWRWREKSPSSGGSSSLLEAHQGKEVLCPSCSCHFMGFPALQKHLAKAHPSIDPKSKHKRGAGTPFTKTDLNRRMPLDSSQGPRLICFSCQQILPADRMPLHLEQEHDLPQEEVSKCSSLSGESQDGPVIGERLKSKMSSKLGNLLDRAVNNLLQAKHKPNNTLSGGAVELLTKLCAVRKREGSVKHRLHGARELLSKLQRQQELKTEDNTDEGTKLLKNTKLFSCSICGLKFALPSSRNKHEVLAHRSYRPMEYEHEEYENDWREAPSPPEIKGENGTEIAINPQCSDCGLSFDTISDLMRHRQEDHNTRRPSVDTATTTTNTGCCPSPVPSSGGSRSLPDSEGEGAGGDSDTGSSKRRRSTRKLRLSQTGSKSVKERAEAALRELNHPRQRTDSKRWLTPAIKQEKTVDVYNFTDDSL